MNKDNIITILVSVIASVVFSVALAANVTGKKAATADVANVDQAIESYLMENPTIVRKALEAAAEQERAEAQKRVAEAYKANIEELNNADNSPFVGPKEAKVTVVEFFDFNCGYCRRLAPDLMKVIKANPDVKFVFKPVTFLGSMEIAKAAMAANEQGKFLEVYEGFLTHNGQIDSAVIEEIIKKAGLDVAKTKEIMESKKVKDSLSAITELSHTVSIQGVPTLILNGEPLQAIEAAPIQEAINNAK